ncbi:glycosyltransferase family 4 protein, partial [Neobacillus drentensis]|uniref:glycosyltransferase family 4 protein n=1 Tax=Neobacillus drentensis TaxID=220684 RepID=UPI003001DF2E
LSVIKAIFTSHTIRSIEVFSEHVTNILDGYDKVFIHDFPLIKYCSHIRQEKVFFICDSQIKLINSYLKNEKNIIKGFILKYKKLIYKRMISKYHRDFGKLLYISEVDKEYDKGIFPFLQEVDNINNGVNFEYFTPSSSTDYEFDIIFLGNFSYRPNYEAASHLVKKIVPELVKNNPDFRCIIVGKNPSKKLMDNSMKDNIIFTGFVEDIRIYLDKAKVFVSPLYSGAGMKNKILEAMAMNKLIIASDISYEGLNLNEDDCLLRANSDREFIEKIEKVLINFESEFISLNNRKIAKEMYSWEKQAGDLLKIIK